MYKSVFIIIGKHHEMEQGLSEHLENDTHVAVVVKPVEHLDTQTDTITRNIKSQKSQM